MLLVGLCLTIVGFVSIRVLESTGVGLQHKNHLISPDAVTVYYQPSLQWQMSFDLKFKNMIHGSHGFLGREKSWNQEVKADT